MLGIAGMCARGRAGCSDPGASMKTNARKGEKSGLTAVARAAIARTAAGRRAIDVVIGSTKVSGVACVMGAKRIKPRFVRGRG